MPSKTKPWEKPAPQNLWGRADTGVNVYEAALDRTRSAFKQFDTVCVMFSGGKDSTCVLNIALQVAEELERLPLHVVFFDEEAIPYQTEDYCRRVSLDPRVRFDWLCLPVAHRNACSREEPIWWPWAPEAEDLWCRPLPPEAITMIEGFPTGDPMGRPPLPLVPGIMFPAEKFGTTVQLMGIRADESLTRRRAVANAREENWVIGAKDVGPNMYKAYPVYDWTTADVWTAPSKLGWDTNSAYDLLEMAGMSHNGQRCAPPYGEQPMQALWTFKCCFPELWDPMTRRVRGAATAAMYARTGLYSFGESAEAPPEGMTWQEFIRERLEMEEDPTARAYIANKLALFIRRHYKKTSDPLVSASHPVSGIGWKWLYKLADRGDFKDRMSVEFDASQEEYDAARAAEAPTGEEVHG